MKKSLIVILAFTLIVGGFVISRPADYTMKPVNMKAAEIAEEMPEILLNERDQAMEERLLTDPSFSAKIASAPESETSFSQYPLEDAKLLLSEWLQPEWTLTDLAYSSDVVIISASMSETQTLTYQFSTNKTSGPHKYIGVYDTEEPFRNVRCIYLNDNGYITKEVRTRVWF